MAAVLLKKRLLNPGRRRKNKARRKLSPKQIKFFGTKAQRAGLKRRGNTGRKVTHRKRARANIGEIITFDLKPRSNTGKRRNNSNMATRRRRRNAPKSWSGLYRKHYSKRKRNSGTRVARRRRRNTGLTTYRRRRRVNSGYTVRRRRSNTGVVATRRRYSRRRNTGARRRNYGYSRRRRNPGFTPTIMKGVGITVGFFSTNYLTNMIASSVPSLGSGYMTYATGLALAFAQGWVVKSILKKADLAEDIVIGGVVNVITKFASAQFPGLSGFRGRGMGLLGASSFTVPQVLAQPGNFAQFKIAPDYANAIAAAAAMSGGKGMGAIFPQANGGSRNSLRRVGRTN